MAYKMSRFEPARPWPPYVAEDFFSDNAIMPRHFKWYYSIFNPNNVLLAQYYRPFPD